MATRVVGVNLIERNSDGMLRGSPWHDGCGVAVRWRRTVEFVTFFSFPELSQTQVSSQFLSSFDFSL